MPGNELTGIKVLITRPQQQAQALTDLIRQAGGEPVVFPALAIHALPVGAGLQTTLDKLSRYHLIIFISPNAVRHLRLLLQQPLPASLKAACVGAGTTRTFHETFARWPDLQPEGHFDSEALLELEALKTVAGKPILIVRGEGGRELLADTLRQRGANVDYAEVYRRDCPPLRPAEQKAIIAAGIDVISITSGEALRNLTRLFQADADWLLDRPLVVVNNRLVELARQLGFKWGAVAASQASDVALLEALIQWRRTREDTKT